jgi:SAM-dependent methyltransferase
MKISMLLAPLLLAAACAGPRTEPQAAPVSLVSPPVAARAPAAAPPHEAPTAATPAPSQANRDLHGPRDTERYIKMLADASRVEQLKPELVARKLAERLHLTPSSVIADVGCGPGVFEWPFAAVVPQGFVFAADVEPAQLDALRAGLAERGIRNVVPVPASYETPHLPPDSCDLIFIADTYHHIEDRVAYFANLRASLTASGALVLLEFKDGELPIGPPPSHKVPRATRHAELTAAGYELTESLGTHIWQDLEIWHRMRATR